jgi:hypothetical protein
MIRQPIKVNTVTEHYTKAKQVAKELHTHIKKNFERRKVICTKPNEIWAMDLCDLTDNKYFDSHKFILTIIDVFTKYGRAILLKNKKGSTVSDVLSKLIKNSKTQPEYIWCDKGKEFYNKDMEALCKKFSIKMYSTESEIKVSVIERWNRTLKEKMEREITLLRLINHKLDPSEVLSKVVYEYNDSIHSTIKMKPFDAIKHENFETLSLAWKKHLSGEREVDIPKLELGDVVRIYKYKSHFEKGYKPNWTEELFKVKRINYTYPVITYTVEDMNGEEIQGYFYYEELLKTKVS